MRLVQVRSLMRFALFIDGSCTFQRGRFNRSSQCYICHQIDSNGHVTDKYMNYRPYDFVYKI